MTDKVTLQERAKQLRVNMTDAERQLWYRLRARRFMNLRFRRQVIIDNFIVDFICQEAKLIIEIDGSQHADNSEYDSSRTKILEAKGYRVVRFWNHEVLQDIDSVMEYLSHLLQT